MRVRTRTWFGFVVVLSLLFILGSRFAVFDPLENAVLTVAAPIESALQDATEPVADFVNNLTDINRLSDENRSLRQERERLLADVARLREGERELEQLRQLIDIREARQDESFVAASVFARESNNFQERVAIGRGSDDGVREGMVVLTRQGSLVGSVTRVLDGVSWVTLITDPASAVSALVQGPRVEGVVAGTADGDLDMEFVEGSADVKEGDLVITSGVGGGYPPGELIGQVVDVRRSAQELFQGVRVEPLADLSRLDAVLVLLSFLPKAAGEP